MSPWTAVALVALGAALTAVYAWAHGYNAGRAEGRREADHHRSTALGWMKVAAAAERRADEAEALLALDFNVRGQV